jgi:acyl carrier protein
MTPSALEIQQWIVSRVSQQLGVPPEEIDVQASLSRYGMDSVALFVIISDLEKWLGYQFEANPLQTHPTIEKLSQFLAEEVAKKKR